MTILILSKIIETNIIQTKNNFTINHSPIFRKEQHKFKKKNNTNNI